MELPNNVEHLTLSALHERHPGLTTALGQSLVEAACVCFSRHHQSPVMLILKQDGSSEQCRLLNFDDADKALQRAYANDIDATENGACGVALVVLEAVTGLVASGRAETLTGADYYVMPPGAAFDDLENSIRLEVSGVDGGTSADVRRRLREKIAQTKKGQSNLPAIASVVGFKVLEVVMSSIEDRS